MFLYVFFFTYNLFYKEVIFVLAKMDDDYWQLNEI